jgi:chemotaxis protein histidine kinase CheA
MVSGQFSASNPDPADLIELQLQQELRAMFEVDSQQYLEDYLNLIQRLQQQSWTKDVQELYRIIHTIKGSAVTVGADAILWVSTILEDLLSDLRHLNPAPLLEDGALSQILLEAGELLAGSLPIAATGEEAKKIIQPSLKRLESLHAQVKQTYLPEWNEQSILHQEFAEQGFGLVILDLEMALETLPSQGEVNREIVDVARQTLAQLAEIGKDLEFQAGWTKLLQGGEDLLSRPSVDEWRSQWTGYLKALQESARQGGQFVIPTTNSVSQPLKSPLSETEEEFLQLDAIAPDLLDLDSLEAPLAETEEEFLQLDAIAPDLLDLDPQESPLSEIAVNFSDSDISQLDAIDSDLLDLDPLEVDEEPIEEDEMQMSQTEDNLTQLDWQTLSETVDFFDILEEKEKPSSQEDLSAPPAIATSEVLEDDWEGLIAPSPSKTTAPVAAAPVESPTVAPVNRIEDRNSDLSIPISLNRLDLTSQSLIDTLLTARTSQGYFQNLQTQLAQLLALAKESAHYITNLRQLQDDYALLDNINSASNAAEGLALERYRQGYTAINRLLETSLRLSEMGAEAEKTSLQTLGSMQGLERDILRLRKTVEQSRLVPFRNLAFRVKAILRDLTVRFGKPARLVVEGENVELDAGTSSKLEPVLLHLIRNAYDHGLESVEERLAKGKPEQSTITLSLKRRGNSYLLDIGDDGRGIDAEAIRRSAETKKLPLSSTKTPSELLAVICQPGFSSKDSISDISGRGVGMDVVATQVNSLGGKLEMLTELDVGTIFELYFPVPHLLVNCILIQAGDRTFAIPSQDVTKTKVLESLKASQNKDLQTGCTWQIQEGDETLPGFDILQYWLPQPACRSLSDTTICLYVHPSQQYRGIWVLADDLLGQSELLVTPLPSPLMAPLGLLGVSQQADGSLIPIVEAAAIAELLERSPQQVISQLTPQVLVEEIGSAAAILTNLEEISQQRRTILVVDDAALMRRRIEVSLTAYGYTVITCNDGQEAWNWLQSNPTPTMVITDIEMPNMDGFTLIDRARQAGISIPMLVVSSRLAEEWSKEARRVGATDYLTKGFSTADLIDKVKSFID